jgi:hypothetical protein
MKALGDGVSGALFHGFSMVQCARDSKQSRQDDMMDHNDGRTS